MSPLKCPYSIRPLWLYIMLIGIELLETLRQDETSDEKTLAKKCGYVTVSKNGAEKILLTPFYEAVLIAKGENW